ncbi:MAG: hypothetical protein KTR31_16680 [Myxococcales bacterium]|nr:hypothetical protein [Myxococcales bacterium]
MNRAGDLTFRVVASLWAAPDADDDTQLATLVGLRHGEPEDRLRVQQVKVYSDGIVWLTTGALLEPYESKGYAGPRGLVL